MTETQLPPSDSTTEPAPSVPAIATEPTSSVPTPAIATLPKKRGLAIAALVVGGVALLFSFIPFINYVSGYIALVGLVLGIIALVQKGTAKGLAGAGTGVSALALILSIVLSLSYTALFFGAVGDSLDSGSTVIDGDSTAADPVAEAPEEVGTRANPAPAGTAVALSSLGEETWEVTVGEINPDATKLITAENMFNEAPPAGMVYVLVPVTATYIGAESGTPWVDISVKFVTASGNTIEQAFVVSPNEFSDIAELYTGASGTGNLVFAMTPADLEDGVFAVSSLFGDPTFIAAK